MSQDNTEVNLMQVQVALEESMRGRGEERYQRIINSAVSRKSEDTTPYGQKLASAMVQDVAKAYDRFKEEVASRSGGPRHTAVKLIGDRLTSEQIAFVAIKEVLSGISGVRTLTRLGVLIGIALETEIRLEGVREQDSKVYGSIVHGAMKRGSQHYKQIYVNRRADYANDGWKKWSDRDRVLVGAKLVELIMETVDLISLERKMGSKMKSAIMVRATPSALEWISNFNNVAGFKAVLEPMVVYPRDWTTPFDGGYITNNIPPMKLVKGKSRSDIRRLYGDKEMPKVYQTVNALQRTAWNINRGVFDTMAALWDVGSELADIPPRQELPLPHKPFDIGTNVEAREQWRVDAAKVYQKNLELVSSRVAFTLTLDLASRYVDFKRIFMPYQLDFRGRIYAVPFLNPQGADFQKALLRFSEGKPLGATGGSWLKIHGANVAGVDKVSFQDRLLWVADNHDEILAIAADPLQNTNWAKSVGGVDIDKPWQFLAFCLEYAGYCEKGEKFVSHLPIALDGSCSGLQHFAAMLRDTKGGEAVNLIPTRDKKGNVIDKPADVYQLVADSVTASVKQDSLKGTEDSLTPEGHMLEGTKTLAAQWLTFGITRKTTKRSVMTLAYGSKKYGFKEQIMEDHLRPAKKRLGDSFPFTGDGYAAASYMAGKIWDSLDGTVAAAKVAMADLQAMVPVTNSNPITWETPSGFSVEQCYPETEEEKIQLSFNGYLKVTKYLTDSVRLTKTPATWNTPADFTVEQAYEKEDNKTVKLGVGGDTTRLMLSLSKETGEVDVRKQAQGIAPNFVHSMDASHLMFTVCKANDSGIKSFAMIHDSFGTHAADTASLFVIVRDQFVEMYQTDVLADFHHNIALSVQDRPELLDKLPERPKVGNLDLEKVRTSAYCFA